ncbi:hypothetical protein LP109_13445 [Moraxella bovis]|uniref:Acb2/Tad1 domain-containing protein n=1 Tax=Moraxella bovis TaxID=476 RepID=UPI0022277E27|nr:hypothetical protein [Moraxella bovis]UZA16594.1 hypothetical protein LP109_13445 [Moraxella bovis]
MKENEEITIEARLLAFFEKAQEIKKAKAPLDKVMNALSQDELVDKRKLALAKTKLEEAMLWLADSFAPQTQE